MADNLKVFQHQVASGGAPVSALRDQQILNVAVGVAGPKPEHVVRPASVEALSSVVKAASAHKIPLWIVWNEAGNGMQISGGIGQPVLLDLSRMNRIVDLDAHEGYALVEPGVSYDMLVEEIGKRGMKLWVDCGRNGSESILGGVVDKSFGYTAYGDRVMMQCGMEVMGADGDLIRTGMGAMPGQNTWQSFKYGYGPISDGLFMQSTLGLPTKMGVWISQVPPVYKPFAVRVTSDSAYVGVMEMFRDLRMQQVVPNFAVAIDGESEKTLLGGDNIAPWNIYGALYGIPKIVNFTWNILSGGIAQVSGAKLDEVDADTSPRGLLMSGKPAPSGRQFETKNAGRSLRLVFAIPPDGQDSLQFATQTRQAVTGAGFAVVVEQTMGWRSVMPEVVIVFEPGKEEAAVNCAITRVQKWAGEGVGVIRASPALMPAALATYSLGGLQILDQRLAKSLAV
jgi:4-cresol dehydrogenase (hydroxylating)